MHDKDGFILQDIRKAVEPHQTKSNITKQQVYETEQQQQTSSKAKDAKRCDRGEVEEEAEEKNMNLK